MGKLRRLAEEESEQEMVEYVSIFMLVAVMSISVLTKFGLGVAGFYVEAEAGF